jgi:hypothetical protein
VNGAVGERLCERVVHEPVLVDEREAVEARARQRDLEMVATARTIEHRELVRIRERAFEQRLQRPGRARRRHGIIVAVAREIAAARRIPQDPAAVFAFLSDLHNHWRLDDRFVELAGVDPDGRGGRVLLRGPLGVSREAATEVVGADPPASGRPGRMYGRAQVGRQTVGLVQWELAPDGTGTAVRLSALVERASLLDRLLLAAGGRWWLRRIFAGALRRLEVVVG